MNLGRNKVFVMLPSIQSRISAKDLITCPEIAARFLCSTAYILQLVRQGKLPQPIRRLGSSARSTYIWETRVVDAWLAPVTWTDVEGNTETGPFWKLRAKAIARGVVFPAFDVTDLPEVDAHGRQLHEPHQFTGAFVPAGASNTDLPDLNFLNAEPDQLTGDVLFQPVRWISDSGEDLGVRPLIDHMQARQAAYGITPNRNVLDPSTPAEGK